MTTTAITPIDNAAVLADFSGGTQSDIAMMIGVGLVKDSEAVFFQYVGDLGTPEALMLPSGKPLTRLANVRLSGIDIAEDIGEFKSTKINLFFESNQGRIVMLTAGLTTIWTQCVLTSLMGMLKDLSTTSFSLDSWKGTSKMRPCFAAIRVGQTKVSDQEMYDLLTEARGNRDSAMTQQLCRNAVAQIQSAIGVQPADVVVEETKTEGDF